MNFGEDSLMDVNKNTMDAKSPPPKNNTTDIILIGPELVPPIKKNGKSDRFGKTFGKQKGNSLS
jgi:hypothetical protein